jgi:DnaJ-class molecular chaperone
MSDCTEENKKACPRCDGLCYSYHTSKMANKEIDCMTCNGKGYVETGERDE